MKIRMTGEARCMIIRNSLLSIRRSALKSCLFAFLIFGLSAVVSVGALLLHTAVALQEQCRDSYLTTAVLEYRGSLYPNRSASDPTAAALRAKLDFDALQKNSAVLDVDRSVSALACLGGEREPEEGDARRRGCGALREHSLRRHRTADLRRGGGPVALQRQRAGGQNDLPEL
jgi:hypothetical protein